MPRESYQFPEWFHKLEIWVPVVRAWDLTNKTAIPGSLTTGNGCLGCHPFAWGLRMLCDGHLADRPNFGMGPKAGHLVILSAAKDLQ